MSEGDRLKIFVSSTVEELKDSRAVVREAIKHFHFIPLMCEDWGANTESVRKTYLTEVGACDIYIGIFWKEYSKTTEEEYQEAKKLGKEILIYVKKEVVEHRDDKLKKLLSEIGNLESGHIYYEYGTVIELREKVIENISAVVSKRTKIYVAKPINFDNLMNFCKKQIGSNVDYLKGASEERKQKKYILDLYVEREELEGKFEKFLNSDRSCSVVGSEAGIGKTNLLCHLAEKYVAKRPVLFYNARNFLYINKSIEEEISDDFNQEFGTLLTFSEIIHSLNEILEEQKTEIIVFIDAINECLHPNDLKIDLAKMVQRNKNNRIKFFISCRDIDWEFFAEDNNEFLQNLFRDESSVFAEKRVLWFRKFTEKEFEEAWGKYKEVYSLKGELAEDVKNICKHPLMLRFLAEAYEGEKVPEDIRRKQIFDKYWERKLIQTGRKFKAEEQIFKIVSELKEQNAIELPEREVYKILSETTDEQNATITKILSEDLITFRDNENIILQPRIDKVGSRVIGFTYEAFFEYVLARYILYEEWKDKNRIEKLEAFLDLIQNIDKYRSLNGAVKFLILLSEDAENNIQLKMIEVLGNYQLSRGGDINSPINVADIIIKLENERNVREALFLIWDKMEYLPYSTASALGRVVFNKKFEKLKNDVIQKIVMEDDDCARDMFLSDIVESKYCDAKDALIFFEDLAQSSNNYITDLSIHAYRLLAQSNSEHVPLDILRNLIARDDTYTQELTKVVLRLLIESRTHPKLDKLLIESLMSEYTVRVPIKSNFDLAINNICATMRLQRSVKERALKTCQDIIKDASLNIEKFEDIVRVSIVSICIACQQSYVPRSIKEISEGTGVNKSEITELFRFLMKKFKRQKVAIDSKKWAQYFCVQLNLYDDISDKAGQILFAYDNQKSGIPQKFYPQSVAAGAVYIAAILSGEHRTQKEIANVSGVSEVTIRDCYKELSENVEIDVLL